MPVLHWKKRTGPWSETATCIAAPTRHRIGLQGEAARLDPPGRHATPHPRLRALAGSDHPPVGSGGRCPRSAESSCCHLPHAHQLLRLRPKTAPPGRDLHSTRDEAIQGGPRSLLPPWPRPASCRVAAAARDGGEAGVTWIGFIHSPLLYLASRPTSG